MLMRTSLRNAFGPFMSGQGESVRGAHRTLVQNNPKGDGALSENRITEEELDELVQRLEEATVAFMRGEMDRYLELTSHFRGFTLMNPFGGPPARYEDRAESIRAAA